MTEEEKEIRKERLAPYMWKPGQSGNPKGRPKEKTMKEWARDVLQKMTDEERKKFFIGMPKEVIWKMAEGNPAQDLTSGGEKIKVVPIYGGASVKGLDNGDTSTDNGDGVQKHIVHEENIQPEEEN